MANGPLIAPLPWCELEAGARIVLEAIDPTDGSTVTGVVISDATIYARATDDAEDSDTSTLAVWLQPQAG